MAFTAAGLAGAGRSVCARPATRRARLRAAPAWDDAGDVWDALLEVGATSASCPAASAARDTLRTEMGYPLHGQDLSLEITPVQARSTWAVGWKKERFWGRDALLAERSRGPVATCGAWSRSTAASRARTCPCSSTARRSARSPAAPSRRPRKVGIGLALLEPSLGEGAEVEVDVRGRPSRMRVVKPPFVPSRVR
jgi:aminomethyltransferase